MLVASNRAKFEADFEYVKDHIIQFFNKGSVCRALDLIDEVGITGWEKWWQVELAAWLAEHDGIGDWAMEEVFFTDLRRKTNKDTIAIDIGFRIKGCSTKEMLFLEPFMRLLIKRSAPDAEFVKRCVRNMLLKYKIKSRGSMKKYAGAAISAF